MKLNPLTISLVGIAALLGIVVFADIQGGDRSGTGDGEEPLFSFEEADVQSFTVDTLTHSLAFERDAEGVWQMTEPEPFLASDASVSFLLNLLATGASDRTLTVPPDDLSEFGLEPPQATVDVVLQDDESHQLVLGGFDFNQQLVYAQVDPPEAPSSDEVEVLLVPASFDTAVNRPVEEWQQVEPPADGADEDTAAPEENSEGDGE